MHVQSELEGAGVQRTLAAEARCCEAECESCACAARAAVTRPDHAHSPCAGQLHGFISMAAAMDRAALALKDCSAALAKALHVSSARPADLAAEA